MKNSHSTMNSATDVPGPDPIIKTAYKEVFCYVGYRNDERIHRA